MIHVQEGQSALNHSFEVDLVATQKHRQSPPKIKVKTTRRELLHLVQEGKCVSSACRGGAGLHNGTLHRRQHFRLH